ncbi:MAG: Fic family protein, partial [Candidatus Omnitrophota bacterium]
TQSLVVAGFQPESFVASAAVIPEPHDSGLVDAVQGLRAETRQVRSSKPVVLEDAEGLPAIGFDSGAVFKTYARRDFWSLVDGKRLPLRSEIRGKDDGQTPGAPRLIGVDFGDITTVYGHQVLLEKLKRLWDPENPVKLVIQGYERPVGPDGNIGEVFHRRTKIFRNLSSPYHQRFYHFDWSVEGHRRVLTVRGLDRAEMRTESVWYQRPLTKGIDAGAVRGGLTGVRAQIDRINQELRSLASDDDPDLYFEEDELAEEWIHPYVQAVKEFNQRITADGPVTAWDMEREYIRLHDTLGRGIIRTAGRYGLLSPEQLGELVSIFVEMFSQRFAEKLEKDPVWAAVNIFVRLVNLQPFYDGNKRAASFILNFILLKAGYEPFILRPKNAVLYRYIMHAIREDNRINEKEFRHFLRLHTKRRSEMRSQPEDDFRRLMKAMREAVERTDYPAALETLRQMHAHPSFPSQDLAFRQTLLREYVNFAYVTGDYSLAITVAESLMGSSVDQAHPAALDYLLGMSYHGLVSDELQAGEAAFGANNQEAIDHLSQCLAAIESGSAPAVMAQDVYFVLAMSYKTQGGLYRRNGDFVSAQESYQEAETLLLRSLARSGFDIRQLDSPKLRLPNSFDVASLAPMKLDPQVLFELVRSKILARKNDGEGDNALSAQEVGLLHNLLNLSLAFEPSMPDRKILFARIHAQLGQLLYDMYAQGSSDGRFIARAVEHLRGAIRDDPGYEESHYWLAEALFLYADHVSGLSGRTSDVPRYLRESLREFEAARGMPQRSGQSQAKIEIIHRRLQNLTKKFPRTEMRAQTRSAPKSIPLGAGEFDDAAHPYVGYAAGFLRGFLRRIEPAAGEFSQSDRSASASADLSWAVQNSFRAFSTEFTRSYYEIAGDMKYERFWERPYLIVKDTEAWLVFKDGKNGLPHGSAVVAYRIDLTQPIASQADLSASDAELLEVLYDEQPLFAGATFGQLERFHLAYRAINHGNAVCFESFMSPLSSGWGLLGSIMDLKKDAAWLRGREILGAVIDEIHRNPMLSWGTSEERNSKIIDLNVYLKWREWFAQSFRKFAVLNEPMRSVFSRVEAAGVRKTLNYKTALEDLYRANLTAFEGLHALTESGDMSALEGGVERMHSSLEVLYQAFVPHVWYQNYLLDLDHDMTAQEKTEFLRRFVERSKDWPYMVTFPAGDDRFFELPLDVPVVWLAFIIDNALRGAEKISQEA